MAAQNNAIRTNHIKAWIDKTQQNSKYRLCGDRDETINHIISECSKLAQKENKKRHDWVGNVIHWKMCKKFKFDHSNKWYKYNPAPVLENDTHKLQLDFDIHTYHLISARRPVLIMINKKRREFAKWWTLLSRRTIEYNWKNVKRGISNLTSLENWKGCGTWRWRLYQLWLVLWHSNLRIMKGTGGLGSWRTRGDYPNESMIENGQNTEKSPGYLLSLKLQWKTIS